MCSSEYWLPQVPSFMAALPPPPPGMGTLNIFIDENECVGKTLINVM